MSRDKEFRARDKKPHKMTKDGVVEVNQTTGEESRISQRGQEFELRKKPQESFPIADSQPASSRGGLVSRQPDIADTVQNLQPEDPYSQSTEPLPEYHSTLEPATEPTVRSSPVDSSFGERSSESRGDSNTGNRQQGSQYQRQFQADAEQRIDASDYAQTQDPFPTAEQSGSVPDYNVPDNTAHSGDSVIASDHTSKADTSPPEPYTTPSAVRTSGDVPFSTSGEDALPDIPHSSDRSGRLQFDKPDATTKSGTKPNQRDTKYAQEFVEKTPTKPLAGERSGRLQFDRPDASSETSAKTKPKQSGTKYTREFSAEKSETVALGDSSSDSTAVSGTKSGNAPRLQFSKDEIPPSPDDSAAPSRKLEKTRMKAERSAGKLTDAKERLPTHRRARIEKTADPTTGKKKRKLHFEPEVKSKRAHIKGAVPLRPVKAGANSVIGFAHKKISQVEQDNVGVEAGHKAELMGESVGRFAYRQNKTAPYRRVAKLERATKKRTVKHMYGQALHDNLPDGLRPKLKSNPLSRAMQKQKIKRQYAKATREAKRGASKIKKVGEVTANAVKAIGGFISRHPVAAGIVLLLLLLVFLITTTFGSCSNMATGVLSSVVSSSYVAEDADIDNAELAYSEWETDLLMEVQNAETDHPGYDEYKYNIADVSHDPYELMAYLTAKYQDFAFADIEAELRSIFDEQYTLTFDEEVEIRTRTVTRTDPDTGEEYEDEEEYEWYILSINLTGQSFTDIVTSRLDSDQRELFDILMTTKGNRQYALNPFDFNWLPNVSSYYGWRAHPISGEKDNHKGIDIAVPVGTEILATHDSKVTFAGNSGDYGLVVVLENDKGLVTKYAHCNSLLVSVGQELVKGDPIATVGSTGNSTGPHLHFEVIQDGQYLNPLFFSETGDDGSGRIPPGSPGGVDIPDYPGEPLGDGSYAALIAEAEKHLGKKYVFGASGPANFDCSGFVCWVYTRSGVYNLPRTNAQGIFNQCTPVSSSNAQPGDLIFFTGTYSTPNACSHIGIYIGNGMMIHCGDPIQYTSVNSSYWQQHFYSYGRLP